MVGGVVVASAAGVVVARPWAPPPAHLPPTAITAPRRAAEVPPTSSPGRPLQGGDLAANHDAPRRDPRGLMQALADRRALVMVHGRADELAGLDVAGSEALRTDTSALTDLRHRGRTYREVVFVVRQARTLSFQAPSATIEAVVDTAAYTVVYAAGAARHAATGGGPMRFSLRWQEERWKIERVSAG